MDAPCAKCGNRFTHTPKGPGRPRKYCDGCRRVDVRRGRYVAAPRPVACAVCNAELVGAGANRRYCSESCKWSARKSRDGIPCEVCGEPTGWTKASGKESVTHKACGRAECGTKSSYARGCRCAECAEAKRVDNREYWRANYSGGRRYGTDSTTRACVVCSAEFKPRTTAITCSPQCRKAHLGRTGDHRSRADLYGVDYERVDRAAIFERDGWTCRICELAVDPVLKFPDPGSATLDHVVPMSRGGGHVEANVQLAHFYCNSVKGNREVQAC